MENLGFCQAFNPLAHVMAEAGRMIRRQAQVFVHVKERDLRPFQIAEFDQLLEKPDLRIAGGEYRRRAPLRHQGLLNETLHLARRVLHQLLLRLIDTDAQGIDRKGFDGLGHRYC